METKKDYTFWQFLSAFRISIPVIQRDYAQGRVGKEELRKRLLSNLRNALIHKEQLVLDFVYGKGMNDCITPLDGQQRLTTLWLLHWYAFLESGKPELTPLKTLGKFSYETRISSREFIRELCDNSNFQQLRKRESGIRESITNKTWFLKEWEQDPTVKAMLNMLGDKENSIESVFGENCSKSKKKWWCDIWELLICDSCPVEFFYLSIESIKQETDDIYIKMNARGEHLTDFENFKADLIKYVRDSGKDWDTFSPNHPELFLSSLIDINWTAVFWKTIPDEGKKIEINEDKLLPSIDRQFFAFLNRFFVNHIMLNVDTNVLTGKAETTDDIIKAKVDLFRYLYGKDGDADTTFRYKDFELFQKANILLPDVILRIKTIMDHLEHVDRNTLNSLGTQLAIISWPNTQSSQKKEPFSFIPRLVGEYINPITQPQRVVFYGICHYLETTEYKDDTFGEWMRFVWNMASNSDVQTIGSMINVIKQLADIKRPDCILDELKKISVQNNRSFFERQLDEEIKKAIVYDNNRERILEAENAFHGSIRFLLNELSDDSIEKAKRLVYSKKWSSTLLPYLQTALYNEEKDPIVLGKDKDDVVKTINYNDNLVSAFDQYLKTNQEPAIKEDNWTYPLISITELLDDTYTITRKIHLYEKNKVKGIYLFKASYWSADSCVLLYSFDSSIQANLVKRIKFIIAQRGKGYTLCNDLNVEKNQLVDENNMHYGRAIIISDKKNTYICAADKYYDNNGHDYKYQ